MPADRRPRSKVETTLEARANAHDDDPVRRAVLDEARRFKASWVDLAEVLADVKAEGNWERWGFPSFEDYARRELFLRPETVDKLLGSFGFLRRTAPKVLDRDGIQDPIPSYQSVDFLKRAEESEGVDDATREEIRRRVLDDAAPLPSLAKRFRDVVAPASPRSNGVRGAATRLRELVAKAEGVERAVVDEVLRALSRLLEALGDEAEK
ncbi:MAG: hypothetical protein WCI05_11160, partial [Myxococcales bacterium]